MKMNTFHRKTQLLPILTTRNMLHIKLHTGTFVNTCTILSTMLTKTSLEEAAS